MSSVEVDDSNKVTVLETNRWIRQQKLYHFLNSRLTADKNLLGAPDLTIRIRNDSVTIHCLLFSAHCFEFSKWLNQHKCHSLPATIDLTPTVLSKDGLRKMIQYVYEDSEVTIDLNTAQSTLIAAAYFRMLDLQKLIEDYSLQLVNGKTKYLPLWLEIAYKNEVDPMYKNDLLRVAARDFQTLALIPEIGRFSVNVVSGLLHRDDLNVPSEFEVFKFALKWMVANNPASRDKAYEVFSTIRFATMPTKQKYECLELAEQYGVFDIVMPHVKMSDWQKTCQDCDHINDTDVKPKPRRYTFPVYDPEDRCPWQKTERYPEPMKNDKVQSNRLTSSRNFRQSEPPVDTNTQDRIFVPERRESPNNGKITLINASLTKDETRKGRDDETAAEIGLQIDPEYNPKKSSVSPNVKKMDVSPSVKKMESCSDNVVSSSNTDEVDVGRPICLHIVTIRTKLQEDGTSVVRYHRSEFSADRECCNHPRKWTPIIKR